MKKIFVALSMVAFLAACDDSSSASAGSNDESGGESSSSVVLGSSSSEKEKSQSSSSEKSGKSSSSANDVSSSSEKLPVTSSSSAGKAKSSSSSVALATPCKTETEDNCEYGTLLDERDGQTYRTVKIGDQVWMAENLNYAYTGVPYKYGSLREGSFTSDSTSWCYDNDPANCDTYGRLYTWAAAMDSVGKWSTNGKGCGYNKTCSPTYPVRGVCPEGWHLPSITEFETLSTAVGGVQDEDYTKEWNGAGTVLKSTSGWYNDGNGTDAFGFSALPAGDGYYGGSYDFEDHYAYFWGSTEYGSYRAYGMYLAYGYDDARLGDYSKYYGFSVRCLKD